MSELTTTRANEGLFRRLWAFLVSLLLSMIGGGIVFAATWYVVTRTPLAAALGSLLHIGARTPWYLSRSAGTVAYLLLAGSTIWGLLLSTKLIKEAVPASLALVMHNFLSWLALAFTGVHAVALLFDSYYTYTVRDLAIPFVGPYRPGWVGLGVVGFYLMALTSFSFNVRKQIGQAWWRRLHYLTFAVFALAAVHGIMAGTDSSRPGMYLVYVGSALLVLFLTNYRLLTVKGKALRQH